MASPDIIGEILPVRLESLERYSLLGELAAPAPSRTDRSTASSITIGA